MAGWPDPSRLPGGRRVRPPGHITACTSHNPSGSSCHISLRTRTLFPYRYPAVRNERRGPDVGPPTREAPDTPPSRRYEPGTHPYHWGESASCAVGELPIPNPSANPVGGESPV